MCSTQTTRRNAAAVAVACCLPLLLLPLCLAQVAQPKAPGSWELPATGGQQLLPVDKASDNLQQLIEAKLNETQRNAVESGRQDVLSRKRRYLVFPEGSSFQMVFDEIICVVDYTNYLVLGITVALAWELPSKPPSEALEDLFNKLEDGTIDISRNDTAGNITYVDAKPNATTPNYINLSPAGNSYYSNVPVYRTPMHPVYQYSNSYYRGRPAKPARRKDNYYYSSSKQQPFKQWQQPMSKAQPTRYPYWALPTHFKNAQRPSNSYYAKPIRRTHKIYPVFGKRSLPDVQQPHRRQRRSGLEHATDEQLTRLEGIQIKYHRNSRQSLYERIERYLDKRGHNGHQCVLRTLCETGQKSQQQQPGSFAAELMRAVFTIPEALDNEPVAYRDTRYDKAHAHAGDCAALYAECKHSIWDAPFIQ